MASQHVGNEMLVEYSLGRWAITRYLNRFPRGVINGAIAVTSPWSTVSSVVSSRRTLTHQSGSFRIGNQAGVQALRSAQELAYRKLTVREAALLQAQVQAKANVQVTKTKTRMRTRTMMVEPQAVVRVCLH